MDNRGLREINHGKYLSLGNAEEKWGWGSPAGKVRAARRAALIATGAGLLAGKKVLEIGCGTGNFTQEFFEYGAEIIAVDISPDLLDIARSRNLDSQKVTFMEKPFEECMIDGPFDAIIGSSILHHLDLLRALEKMANLLKPGGIISFAEPNYLNPQIFLERKFRKWFPNVSPDETAFVSWQLKKDLDHCGFDNIYIKPFDWLHPSTPEKTIGLVSRLGTILESIPLVRNFSGSLYIRAHKKSGSNSTS